MDCTTELTPSRKALVDLLENQLSTPSRSLRAVLATRFISPTLECMIQLSTRSSSAEAGDAQALVVCESTDGEVGRRLVDGDIDIAILASRPEGAVHSLELVRDTYFIWAHENSRLAQLEHISMSDLEGETLALFDLESKLSDPFVLAASKAGVHLIFVGELIRVFELARAGRGFGLTCRNHVDAMRGTGVVGVPFDFLGLTYYLCYRLDRLLSPTGEAFVRYMEGHRTIRGRKVAEVLS